MNDAAIAWEAHCSGNATRALFLASGLPFPAPLSDLSIRAMLLARYGPNTLALPAIGQYGASAARDGNNRHLCYAEMLAAVRVDPRELDVHHSRLELLKTKLGDAQLSQVLSELASLFKGQEERLAALNVLEAHLRLECP